MRGTSTIAVGLGLSLIAACHRGKPPAPSPASPTPALPAGVTEAMVAAGDTIFNTRSCVRCHQLNALGGPRAPSLRDSTWIHVDGSYPAIVGLVTTGFTKAEQKDPQYQFSMNPRGGVNLTDAEIAAVAAYVWSIAHRGKPGPTWVAPAPAPTPAAAGGMTPQRADSIFQSGNFVGAIRAYEALTAATPQAGPMWFRLGMSNYRAGRFGQAGPAFEKAADLAGNPLAIYNAGASYARAGQPDKAFVWLSRAAATGKLNPEQFRTDEDLAAIRSDARFAGVVAEATNKFKPPA